MKKLQIRKWEILVCGILLFFITAYAVSAKVRISRDNSIQTGGEVYRIGELTDREMNVFGNASTVSGKTAVIAPGSKGCYTFTIQNTKDFPVEISWQLSDENQHKIPMQYRLKVESGYLYGSAKEWVVGEKLDKYLIEDQLSPGEQREYALDWEWPFFIGEEQDQKDTELGNLAASGKDVNYQLCLSLRAEGEENNINGGTEKTEGNTLSDSGRNETSGSGEQLDKKNVETSETEAEPEIKQDTEKEESLDKDMENEQQKIEVSTLQEKKRKHYLLWWILLIPAVWIFVLIMKRWKKNPEIHLSVEDKIEENR